MDISFSFKSEDYRKACTSKLEISTMESWETNTLRQLVNSSSYLITNCNAIKESIDEPRLNFPFYFNIFNVTGVRFFILSMKTFNSIKKSEFTCSY